MGKTAVFVLSVLQQLPENPKPISALVICHTRELAYQIKNEFIRLSTHLHQIRTEVIYGGIPIEEHVKMLKNHSKIPHILVGTPGRVLALAKRGVLDLNSVTHFIIDECDRVLGVEGKLTLLTQ